MYSLLDINLFQCYWSLSRRLLYLLVGLYSISLIIIWRLSLIVEWRVLIAIVFSCYVFWIVLKHILFILPNSFIALRRDSSNWLIYNKQDGWQLIQLRPSSCVVLSWIIVLQFCLEDSGKYLTVCLPIDAMSKDDHRKLRIYLRYLR